MPNNTGFTLIELLIAIAIIGILSAIAIPSYQQYTKKAHYTEVVQATAPFKLGIEECFQITGSLKECKAGKNGVPPNIENGAGLINKISVAEKGSITVIPRNKHGIKSSDHYILRPTIKKDQLIWNSDGEAITKGYAN